MRIVCIECYHFCSIVMAAVPSTSSVTSDNSQNSSDTNLSLINTEDELHTDLSTLTSSERKKLQHMTAFHEEYQWIFGEKASICTIMKWRISHMNPLFLNPFVKRRYRMLV